MTVETLAAPVVAAPPLRAGPGRGRFPPRARVDAWPATRAGREAVWERLTQPPFVSDSRGSQKQNRQGLDLALGWLSDQPGDTWQQRWLESGADTAADRWRQIPAGWLQAHDLYSPGRLARLCRATTTVICADVVRPSLSWFVQSVVGGGALARGMARSRDADGFARLADLCDADPHVHPAIRCHTLHRAAVIVAVKGGTLADITTGDVLELIDLEIDTHRVRMTHAGAFYRMLHQLGVLEPAAPPGLRQAHGHRQQTPAELVDRYDLVCAPIRDLLVEYLTERQSALDYSSLRSLAADLAGGFWKDLERHHPGIDSLHLPTAVADGWKQRLRTRPQTIVTDTGKKATVAVERISYRQCLTPVRAFYLDLAQWALEEPGRWAQWVAPCPIGQEEINQRKAARHRKARMDARTRERLPVLPVLVRTVDQRRKAAAALLHAARQTQPGQQFTVDTQTLTRSVLTHPTAERIWVDEPTTGRRRDLGVEEDLAFWTWAAVEVLRATGVRIEELLELSHHSLVRYRLPSTSELVPLLQIVPSKTDSERLLVVSPELADVLSTIIRRVRDTTTGAIPIIAAYDRTECVWLQPAPWLFQRRFGAERRRICGSVIRNLLKAALADTGLTDAEGQPLRYTPHDFRRMFITDAIVNGLPPHIAQVIAGHRDINVTLGIQGGLPRRGHPGPPGVPGPPAGPAPQ